MQADQLISLYNALFYASMALCILGFVLAVLFFFVFDIRKIFVQITGRGKDKLMTRGDKANTRSLAKERRRNTAGIRSSELYTAGITGGIVPPPQAAAASANEEGTTPLNRPAAPSGDETTALNAPPPAPAPSPAPYPEKQETVVLSSADRPEAEATDGEPSPRSSRRKGRISEVTTMLKPKAPAGFFELTETVIEIHTEELI